MPGFVIDGQEVQVEGLEVLNWNDDPRLKLSREDYCPRGTGWIRGVVPHSTSGYVSEVLPGLGPNMDIESRTNRYWSTAKNRRDPSQLQQAGAHIVVDVDGSMACLADLKQICAYHAGTVNGCTIGIEIGQMIIQKDGKPYGRMWQGQIAKVVLLIDFLTRYFGIQRQVQKIYHGHPFDRVSSGAKDCVGVFFHRDQTEQRGRGDPGDHVPEALIAAGYKAVDYKLDEDKALWIPIQRDLNTRLKGQLSKPLTEDGVAGPATVAAMKLAGYKHGLLVSRPND